MKTSRFWVLMVLLVGATVVLRVRGDVDRVPPSRPLSELPETIGAWSATDIALDPEVLETLGKGVFLNRVYSPMAAGAAQASPVGLFIGYFPTQRTGQSIHSPQHCLPGAGWVFDSSGVTGVKTPDGQEIQVGEYVISNGAVKQEVLYWYRLHGRNIANDYVAKLYTLADSLRYSRTDEALVRIVTPIAAGESREDAHRRAVGFAEQMDPMLPAFIPN